MQLAKKKNPSLKTDETNNTNTLFVLNTHQLVFMYITYNINFKNLLFVKVEAEFKICAFS